MKQPFFAIVALTAMLSPVLADAPAPKTSEPAGAQFKANIQNTPAPSDLPISNYQETINTFRASYKAMGKPKILLYINRNLVKERGEMMTMSEATTSTQTKGDPIQDSGNVNVQVGSNNTSTTTGTSAVSGKGGERSTTTGAAVRVIPNSPKGVTPITEYDAREIEEAFQRPFFDAGTRFVDQQVAFRSFQKFKDPESNFLTAPKTDAERAEVENLKKATDIVIEILALKKWVPFPQPSGNDEWKERLELTATAISLKDGTKLAQVSSNSLFGFNRRDGARKERQSRQVTPVEMIEQVALKVMQNLEP